MNLSMLIIIQNIMYKGKINCLYIMLFHVGLNSALMTDFMRLISDFIFAHFQHYGTLPQSVALSTSTIFFTLYRRPQSCCWWMVNMAGMISLRSCLAIEWMQVLIFSPCLVFEEFWRRDTELLEPFLSTVGQHFCHKMFSQILSEMSWGQRSG